MTYGCYNRAPFKLSREVQDGYQYGHKKMVTIEDPMSKECQYTHTDLGKQDPKCVGCKHKAKP